MALDQSGGRARQYRGVEAARDAPGAGEDVGAASGDEAVEEPERPLAVGEREIGARRALREGTGHDAGRRRGRWDRPLDPPEDLAHQLLQRRSRQKVRQRQGDAEVGLHGMAQLDARQRVEPQLGERAVDRQASGRRLEGPRHLSFEIGEQCLGALRRIEGEEILAAEYFDRDLCPRRSRRGRSVPAPGDPPPDIAGGRSGAGSCRSRSWGRSPRGRGPPRARAPRAPPRRHAAPPR